MCSQQVLSSVFQIYLKADHSWPSHFKVLSLTKTCNNLWNSSSLQMDPWFPPIGSPWKTEWSILICPIMLLLFLNLPWIPLALPNASCNLHVPLQSLWSHLLHNPCLSRFLLPGLFCWFSNKPITMLPHAIWTCSSMENISDIYPLGILPNFPKIFVQRSAGHRGLCSLPQIHATHSPPPAGAPSSPLARFIISP